MTGPRQRVIQSSETQGVRTWSPPEVGSPDSDAQLRNAAVLADAQTQIHREGFEAGRQEGRASGYQEGLAEAKAEAQVHSARFLAILQTLARPLDGLDDAVEQSLVDLAIMIARQLVRRELKINPGEVVAIVREALAHLPVAARDPRIHLNPDDVDLVRGALSLNEVEDGYHLQADPLVARGGCLVETTTSYIDATVEARLSAIISKMLGGGRESDRGT